MTPPTIEWLPLPPPEPKTYTFADWVDAIAVGAFLSMFLIPLHFIIT